MSDLNIKAKRAYREEYEREKRKAIAEREERIIKAAQAKARKRARQKYGTTWSEKAISFGEKVAKSSQTHNKKKSREKNMLDTFFGGK